jgi:hypothetical protein
MAISFFIWKGVCAVNESRGSRHSLPQQNTSNQTHSYKEKPPGIEKRENNPNIDTNSKKK